MLGEATLGSFTGYSIKELIFFLFGIEQLVAANRNDGLYTATGSNEPIGIPPSQSHASVAIARALAFPTFVGDSLVYRGYHIRTSALNEIIKVPAGTFRCIVYAVTVQGDTLAMIWATPGVGFVRMWQQLGSVWEVKELTGYQVQWVFQIPTLWGMSHHSTDSALPHLPPFFEARVSPNKNATLFSGGIAGVM